MSTKDLNFDQIADLFPPDATNTVMGNSPVRFGASEDLNPVDFLTKSTTEQTTESPAAEVTTETSTTQETTEAPVTPVDENENKADLLGTSTETKSKKQDVKTEIKDLSGYFEDRLKAGKFVAIEEDAEDGTKKQFIPKTFEEFDEVIDIQVNYRLDQQRKELEQKWYQAKSPAWQAVAKYAELTDDPGDILPFIQGVKTIDDVKDVDPSDLEGAERIVRTRLSQRGETQDAIDEQVEALKTTDKLVSAAQKYKPLILTEQKQQLAKMVQQKKEEEEEYMNLVQDIRNKAIEAIEAPIFGKQKLKQEEKAVVYDLIAEPSQETQGYRIYSAIDALFEKGDFETLKQVALLLGKKDSFINYISSGAADQTAAGLQRKLRVATDSRAAGSNNSDSDDGGERTTVQRNQFSPTPRFGRSAQ